MNTNVAEKKPALEISIWIGFCLLAACITWLEISILNNSLAYSSNITKMIYSNFKMHDSKQAWMLMLVTDCMTFIIVSASALMNPLVITKLAGKRRRPFAQGFALASLVWLFFAGTAAIGLYHIIAAGHDKSPVLTLLPAVFALLAAVMQFRTSMEVARENLHQFEKIGKLSAEDKQRFEDVIHRMKKAQNKDECSALATRCLKILSLKGEQHVGTDDFHTLTKELVKQNRNRDAEEISAHYIALIEPTLLP